MRYGMRAPIRGVAVAGLAAALVTSAVPASAGARHDKTPHAQGAKPAKPAKHESAEHALVHWINVQREQRGLRPSRGPQKSCPCTPIPLAATLRTEIACDLWGRWGSRPSTRAEGVRHAEEREAPARGQFSDRQGGGRPDARVQDDRLPAGPLR